LTDEQWFSQQALKQVNDGIHSKYQQELRRQQAKINELEQAQVIDMEPFQGITVKPVWEGEEDEKP